MIGDHSDQKIVNNLTPPGYPFDHTARTHKNVKESTSSFVFFKCETQLRFQTNISENNQLNPVSINVAIIYRLDSTRK